MPDYNLFGDEQLLKASRDGEEAAWEALMRRHGQRLLAFFTRMNGGDLASAKDLWVNLWAELARRRPSLASGPSFSTTAFDLALKAVLDGPAGPPKSSRFDPASLEGRRDRLYEALSRLPASDRAALCLGYFDNLPWEEMARVLGCHLEEAKSRCAAGFARLDADLGPGFLLAGL